jgi:hypothetical protein
MISYNRKKIYTFDAPKSEKFLGNHLEKILVFFLMVPFFFVFKGELSLNGYLEVVFSCIVLMFIFVMIQKKFAYKISIDLVAQKIQFHMYRSNKLIEASFSKLDTIRINGYVIFRLHDRTIFYKDLQNNKLFECLNRVKKIEWGIPMCQGSCRLN